MSDNVECPFCGIYFPQFVNAALAYHPKEKDCPVACMEFTTEQWAMRPPKKEQPAQVFLSELEYLRGLLEKVVIQGVGLRG